MWFVLFLFFMLIPFSYFDILGVRLILLQVLVGVFLCLLPALKRDGLRFYFDFSMSILIVLLFVALIYGLKSGYLNELLAMSVFFLLIFFLTQIDKVVLLEDAVKLYKLSVLFAAFGVCFQLAAHKIMGLELFRYQLFGGGRSAYSFIWEDYSFLSLFIVSAIPLFFEKNVNLKFSLIAVFLLLSSVITSARTGVVAFILFVILYVGCEVFKSIFFGKIKKTSLVILISLVLIPPVMILGMEGLTGRQVTVSSSGRMDDFILGFHFFKERILFGFLFDKELYNQMVSIIPHNIFIYMLYMGGGIAFLIFMAWVFSVVMKVRFSDRRLISALCICLFGFQFIPSFFSAYFFAVLLGLAMVSSRLNWLDKVSYAVNK